MALTKSDLTEIKKIVKEVVRDEIGNETKSINDSLSADITLSRIRIQEEIRELTDRIKNLEIRLSKMHKELKEEIKIVSHFLDKENLKAVRRIEKIEDHLRISTQ